MLIENAHTQKTGGSTLVMMDEDLPAAGIDRNLCLKYIPFESKFLTLGIVFYNCSRLPPNTTPIQQNDC